VVFSRGLVVGFGGVALIAEIAQMSSLTMADDGHPPQSLIFGEPDAFVAGAGISFPCVPGILSGGTKAPLEPRAGQGKGEW